MGGWSGILQDVGNAASAIGQGGGNGDKKQTFNQRKGNARAQGQKSAGLISDVGSLFKKESDGQGGGTAPASSSGTSPSPTATPPQMKKGGRVKKTGMAKVHKGERVLTKKQAKKYEKKKGKKRY